MTKRMHRKTWAIAIAVLLGACWIALDNIRAIPGEKRESVEDRLQRLEDREAIHQLLMDYGRHLDQRDFASFSELFAEKEGEWIGGMGKAKGPKAIRKLMEDTIGGNKDGKDGGANCHLFTNESMHVNGNQATAITKWIFVVQNNAKQPQPVYVGHYDDTLVRETGRWKFLRRIVYGEIPPDDPLSRK